MMIDLLFSFLVGGGGGGLASLQNLDPDLLAPNQYFFFFYLDDWDENAKMLCSLFANNTVLGKCVRKKKNIKTKHEHNTKA